MWPCLRTYFFLPLRHKLQILPILSSLSSLLPLPPCTSPSSITSHSSNIVRGFAQKTSWTLEPRVLSVNRPMAIFWDSCESPKWWVQVQWAAVSGWRSRRQLSACFAVCDELPREVEASVVWFLTICIWCVKGLQISLCIRFGLWNRVCDGPTLFPYSSPFREILIIFLISDKKGKFSKSTSFLNVLIEFKHVSMGDRFTIRKRL